jgi:ubiquinone/menaquinone biosynthesis C-methylase UbiE
VLKRVFDGVMDRRSRGLIEQVGEWLPGRGPVLDVGSGTGHFAARLALEKGIEIVPADVTDLHVVGPAPVPIRDGVLPFDDRSFSAALMLFMLAYPSDPAAVLAEAARVTGGPVILVQTVSEGVVGRGWHRVREFVWTTVAFYVSRAIGYVPAGARFTMHTRRFYTAGELAREVARAGLRVRSRRDRAVLPGGALVVVGWALERDA